jgi:hypothetical protein
LEAQVAQVDLVESAGKPMPKWSLMIAKQRCRDHSIKPSLLLLRRMQLLVHSITNARVDTAWMAFVVIASATTNAWRVVQQRKEVALTAFAVLLRMIRIPITIALLARVTGKICARITMGILALQRPSACRITASMDSAAETSVWVRVKRARQRKKAVEVMGFAETLHRERIPTVNAQAAGRVMELELVPRALRNSPMGRHVVRRRNAIRDFALTACVVTVGV